MPPRKTTARKTATPDLKIQEINPRAVARGMIVIADGTQKPEVVLQVDVILHLSNGEQNIYVGGEQRKVQHSTLTDAEVTDAVKEIKKRDPDTFHGVILDKMDERADR